ncbi:MAG: ankyrin repeat domain-containing protein [Pseudomonadota bacterium]
MKKIVFFLLLSATLLSGADIFKLVQTIDRNDTIEFKRLVQTIEDANTARSDNNKTILMYSSWVGNIDAVKHLVDLGANVNAQDSSNATALHLAIWKDHTDIALYLIEHAASVSTMSMDGMTPGDIAILRSNTKVIEAINQAKPKLKSLF